MKARLLAALYLALLLALWFTAWLVWRLRCEGFGCLSVGLAWFAWIAGFALVLALGALARRKAEAGSEWARICSLAWRLQLATAALLIVFWLRTQLL